MAFLNASLVSHEKYPIFNTKDGIIFKCEDSIKDRIPILKIKDISKIHFVQKLIHTTNEMYEAWMCEESSKIGEVILTLFEKL